MVPGFIQLLHGGIFADASIIGRPRGRFRHDDDQTARFHQGCGFGGGLSLAAPFVVRSGFAQSSSGNVNIFAWAGYINDDILGAFEKATGIKPNYTPYGTNDELLNQLRANNGAGFDVIWPSVDRVPNYVEFNLVQPLDEAKIDVAKCLPSAWTSSANLGAVVDGKRYQVPTDWGTEALS